MNEFLMQDPVATIKLVTAVVVLLTALLKLWDEWHKKPPSQKPPSADGSSKTEPELDPARTICLVTATGPALDFRSAKPPSKDRGHKTG